MTARALEVFYKRPALWFGRWLDVFIILAIVLGIAVGIGVVFIGQPALILFAVGGLIIFIGSVISAEFGLLILVFLAYTRISDILVHNYNAPSVAKFFVPLLVVAILVRWVFNREPPLGWQRPAILLTIYGMVGFASILYAPDPERVWNSLVVFSKDAIITVIVVVLLHHPNTFRKVIWTLLFIGIFLGTLSIYQYITGTYANDYWGFAVANIQSITGQTNDYRSAGPIGDPNYYAQVMGVLIPLALEKVLHERRPILRGLALWALIASVFAVFLTYSRGGFIAMVIALVAYFIIYPPKVYYVPVAIIGALFLMTLAPPKYFDRILSLTELFSPKGGLMVEDYALRGRASENLAALEMVKAQPLFGVGFSNFSFLFNQYSKQAGLALVATERAAHNLYLEVVAETGLVGFAVFMTMLYTSLRTISRAWVVFVRTKSREYAGMAASFGVAFLGYLVAAFFIHNAFPRYFYLMIGLSLSFEMMARTHLQELRNKDAVNSNASSPLSGGGSMPFKSGKPPFKA
jgi:putative inorganic carbon (hco3(-)) transporter